MISSLDLNHPTLNASRPLRHGVGADPLRDQHPRRALRCVCVRDRRRGAAAWGQGGGLDSGAFRGGGVQSTAPRALALTL